MTLTRTVSFVLLWLIIGSAIVIGVANIGVEMGGFREEEAAVVFGQILSRGFLELVVFPIALLCAFGVASDASKNKIPVSGENYSANTGALAWWFTCFLLGIVGLIIYFVRKSEVTSKRAMLK